MKAMRITLSIFLAFTAVSCDGGSDNSSDSLNQNDSSPGNQINYLLNPGFEEGFDNWVNDTGLIRNSDPSAYEGGNYLYGVSEKYSVQQEIDLEKAGIMLSTLDSGIAKVTFGGWQSGWNMQEDQGSISLVFFDANKGELGLSRLPFFFSNHTWVEQTGESIIPIGTRVLLYRFDGVRKEGSNNDAYLDSAYVRLN